jgi:hypothetical protein
MLRTVWTMKSLRVLSPTMGQESIGRAQADLSRPRSRQLVEAWPPLTLRELISRRARDEPASHTLTLAYSDGRTLSYLASDLLDGYTQSFLGGRSVWIPLLRCPGCGSRRRVLYVSTRGLGCRGCFRLTYQSKCETWDWPTAEAVDKRLRILAREPGPKGSRYRAWERRGLRIGNLQARWLREWVRQVDRDFGSPRH